MKRILLLTAALALVAPAAAQAGVVVKEKRHGGVEVKIGPGVGHPHQAGHFWRRGKFYVRLHGPAYRWPHGYHYRRWAVGAVLPAVFLADEYYYSDYATAGLEAPPPGYRWVRYGSDLLLVNIRTGAVEDVVEDAFE